MVRVSRWITLGSNLALQIACGTSYAFSVYSDHLKNTTGFNQREMNQIASIGNIGFYIAIVAGLLFDKKGPIPPLVIGMIMSALGYALMWAAAMGYLGDKGSTVGWYSFYMFVWSNGAAFYDTVCIGTNVRNFPNDRGRVTGLLKAFMGLSASIVTIFFTSVFKDDKTLFILFLGALTGGLGLLACFATSLVPTRKAVAISQRDSKWLNAGMLCLAILMIYVLTIAIVETTNPELGGALWTSMAMLPLIALQAVVMVPACLDSKWWINRRKRRFMKRGRHNSGPTWAEEVGEDSSAAAAGASSETTALLGNQKPADADAIVATGSSLVDIMKDLNFWLLSFMVMCGTGAGLTFINNLGQQVKALAGTNPADRPVAGDVAALHVVILSIANCFGRIVWGFCSDRFPRVTRVGWMTMATAATAASMLFCSFATNVNVMYAVTCCIGFCYGGYWALIAPILSDMWGTKWFAVIYSVIALFPAFGGYIFSTEMAGAFYQAQVVDGESDCYGVECYELTYQLLGAINALGMCVGALLWWRTKTKFVSEDTGSISVARK